MLPELLELFMILRIRLKKLQKPHAMPQSGCGIDGKRKNACEILRATHGKQATCCSLVLMLKTH